MVMITDNTARMNPVLSHADAMSDRTFGLFVGAVLAGIGAWPVLFGRSPRPILLAIASVLVAFGAVAPRALHRPKRIWLGITQRVGQVVQFLLMGILFFLVITPVALFFKIIGRDALRRKWDAGASSYWIARGSHTSMKHQF